MRRFLPSWSISRRRYLFPLSSFHEPFPSNSTFAALSQRQELAQTKLIPKIKTTIHLMMLVCFDLLRLAILATKLNLALVVETMIFAGTVTSPPSGNVPT
jgi:hypothetical protein